MKIKTGAHPRIIRINDDDVSASAPPKSKKDTGNLD